MLNFFISQIICSFCKSSLCADILIWISSFRDHEGGNVCSHTSHLVASALSDPYRAYASAVNGLAGPIHGSAIQEGLLWVKSIVKEFGENISIEQLKELFVWKTLNSGKVRYLCQNHCLLVLLFLLLSKLYEVVPPILMEQGKVKNPWPNVDARSGVLLHYFGITEARYHGVLFAVARSLGICSQQDYDAAHLG
ncbi:putative citrate synthase [Dioscorea sansibarensis]